MYDTRASVVRKEYERVSWQCFLDPVEEPIGSPPINIGSPVWFMAVHIYERKRHALEKIPHFSSRKKGLLSD